MASKEPRLLGSVDAPAEQRSGQKERGLDRGEQVHVVVRTVATVMLKVGRPAVPRGGVKTLS